LGVNIFSQFYMDKTIMGDLSKHFDRSEFLCKGEDCAPSGHGNCGKDTIDYALVEVLESVREHFGKPVVITSANRCAWYNQLIGGVSSSQHLLGRAADIKVKGVSPDTVADFLEDKVSGLGRYSTFTHIDTRENGARWSGT
jgi:uncharacterized protein YcbK (DUF882 family)